MHWFPLKIAFIEGLHDWQNTASSVHVSHNLLHTPHIEEFVFVSKKYPGLHLQVFSSAIILYALFWQDWQYVALVVHCEHNGWHPYITGILWHTLFSSKNLSEEQMQLCPFASLEAFCIPVAHSMHLFLSPATLHVLQFWWHACFIISIRIQLKSYCFHQAMIYTVDIHQCTDTCHFLVPNYLNPGTLSIRFLEGPYNCCKLGGTLLILLPKHDFSVLL